jgi:catechol 2,3-dioxygenase-like lactoylglutathione lyase family enzyme
MEDNINQLISQYEIGNLSRRQLVQSLAMAALAFALPRRAAAETARSLTVPSETPYANGFKTIGIDHISYTIKDYKETAAFYQDLMGMKLEFYEDNAPEVRMFWGPPAPGMGGGSHTIARNRRSETAPPALVDHISYQIADWDTQKVEDELKRRGLNPGKPDLGTKGRRPWASFHVKDPNGYDLQISGDIKPGDREYKGPYKFK